MSTHTDSVETTIEEILNDNRGETLYDSENANEIAADAIDNFIEAVLPKLQAHTSQQVEEAVKAERLKVISEIEAEVNTLFVFGRQVGIGGLYTTAAMRGPNEEVASWVKKEDVLVCIDKAKPLSTPNHQD